MKIILALAVVILLAGVACGLVGSSSAGSVLGEKREQLIKVKNSMIEMDVLEKAAKSVVPSTSDLSALIAEYAETKASLQSVAARLNTEINALETLNCQTTNNCTQKSQDNGMKGIGNSIKTGTTLKDVDMLISSNGRYTLSIKNGDLMIMDTAFGLRIWLIPHGAASRLILEPEGNVVLRDANGAGLWHTQYTGKEGPYTLVLENNGDLVYYDKNNAMIWHSKSENGNFISWEIQGVMRVNDLLTSLNGRFMFKVKEDGDCVLSDRSTGKKLWSTGTKGVGNTFNVQRDGNLVVYNKEKTGLWHIASEWKGSREGPYRLTLSNEGALVFYDRNNVIVWQRNGSTQ